MVELLLPTSGLGRPASLGCCLFPSRETKKGHLVTRIRSGALSAVIRVVALEGLSRASRPRVKVAALPPKEPLRGPLKLSRLKLTQSKVAKLTVASFAPIRAKALL